MKSTGNNYIIQVKACFAYGLNSDLQKSRKPDKGLPTLNIIRRRRDSNPRAPEGKRISSAPRYDHFDTSAFVDRRGPIHEVNWEEVCLHHEPLFAARRIKWANVLKIRIPESSQPNALVIIKELPSRVNLRQFKACYFSYAV